jgi:hypothetical protein
MAGYSIDPRQLMVELEASDPLLKREAEVIMRQQYFEPAVAEMKREFMEHEVTKEILGGVNASNTSATLEGKFRDAEGDSPANLTSFIGFDAPPEQVIAPILQRLDPRHEEGPKLVYKSRSKDRLEYVFEVVAPDEGAIYNETPFPDSWLEGDISWVKRIEAGIPGIAHFLNVYGRPSSRSGGGIQIEGTLRTGRYRPTSYLTRILNNFLRRVVGRSDNGRTI